LDPANLLDIEINEKIAPLRAKRRPKLPVRNILAFQRQIRQIGSFEDAVGLHDASRIRGVGPAFDECPGMNGL
jgi:hypothetical protein